MINYDLLRDWQKYDESTDHHESDIMRRYLQLTYDDLVMNRKEA